MHRLKIISLMTLSLLLGAANAMAIEEAPYNVTQKNGEFEIRDYASHIVAETSVDGDLEAVGSKAFNILFGYISGANRSQEKVDMTTPVSQRSTSKKIDMTAPVGQQRNLGRWVVSFMMPAAYTMETLPEPENPEVRLREVPARRMAAVRYSGFWNEKGYLKNKSKLEKWIDENGLRVLGEPIWARYNSPFTPWFLRRNEVLIPVQPGDG